LLRLECLWPLNIPNGFAYNFTPKFYGHFHYSASAIGSHSSAVSVDERCSNVSYDGSIVHWDASEYKVIIDTKNKQPVFFINPALSDTYYQCVANLNTDFENLIPQLKRASGRVKLTDEEREDYLSTAKSHVENVIGNVDYSKEFAPYYPDAPFTGIMKSVYDDAVKKFNNKGSEVYCGSFWR